jgi:putative membrane protein
MHLATLLLADSWHHGGHAWWALLWLFWLTVIGLVVFLLVRRGGGHPSASAILAERYARGEISAEEYRERLGNLR